MSIEFIRGGKVNNYKETFFLKQLLFLILIPFLTYSQELLKDPGFEALRTCPAGTAMLNSSIFWYSPTQGTPDLFNKCAYSSSPVSVPRNVCGKQKPWDGNGYAGLIMYEYQYLDYKEYLQGELGAPLQKGGVYKISFHISLADESMYAVDKIQVAFTKDPVRLKGHTTMLDVNPQLTFEGDDHGFYTDKKNWVLLTTNYTAEGGEKFLTIGNFIPDKYGQKRVKIVNKKADVASAYYYIDGVSFVQTKTGETLTELTIEELPIDAVIDADTLKPGDSFILKNILFDTDKDVLLPISYTELNKLLSILEKFPAMELEIRGHTDDQASEDHNMDLSSRRALAVKKYLVASGIDNHRLKYKAFGESKPIADNSTEEGRSLNRRVEFVVLKK